jgi:hypothetical protein
MQKPGWLSKSWLNKHKGSIAGGTVLAAGVIGIIALLYQFSWTGFGPGSTKTTERNAAGQVTKTIEVEQSAKTLWDWLSLLGVPLSLAILGFLFQQREQTRSNQQAELEKEIAAANQREEALQAYFDRLSTLLIDKNLIAVAAKVKQAKETEAAQPDPAIDEQKELLDTAVDVIRARTLSILRQFGEDGERKSSVIRFLIEIEAIEKLNLSLFGVNLSHVNLSGANLCRVNFRRANLSSADLRYVNFSQAYFRRANLSDADLRGTNLRNANLNGADLSRVKNWTEEQLGSAKLCQTQLPEGCNLDPDRDCQELESRVKGDR